MNSGTLFPEIRIQAQRDHLCAVLLAIDGRMLSLHTLRADSGFLMRSCSTIMKGLLNNHLEGHAQIRDEFEKIYKGKDFHRDECTLWIFSMCHFSTFWSNYAKGA